MKQHKKPGEEAVNNKKLEFALMSMQVDDLCKQITDLELPSIQ